MKDTGATVYSLAVPDDIEYVHVPGFPAGVCVCVFKALYVFNDVM